MKKIILLSFFVFSLIVGQVLQLKAQCPPNIGFELGNTNGWQSFISGYGTSSNGCCPIVANVGPFPNRQFWTTQSIASSRIRVIGPGVPGWTALTTDPYSGLSMVCPASGNNYSLKIGNDSTGSQSERIRIQIPITSGNTTLIYRYAAVMGDGGHDSLTQPRLDFKVYDAGPTAAPYTSGPVIVPCASFIQATPPTGSYPLGWFAGASNTVCSNWVPIAVNLSKYVNHSIIIQFATGDCDFGGHFGYAYVDIPGGCKPFTILTGYCSGQDTAYMQAPVGFGTYTWFNKAVSPMVQLGVGNNIKIRVNNLGGPPPYPIACVVTPAAGLGCNDTLVDTLRVLPDPTAGFTYNQNICAGSPVQFIDTSKTHVNGSYIVHWEWDFNGDNITDDTTQNPLHIFPITGNYTIRLIVKSDLSCISDTAFGQVISVALPAITTFSGNDTSICQGQTVQLNGSNYQGYTYKWTLLDGTSAMNSGVSNDSISNPTTTPVFSSTYVYTITDTAHGCFFSDTMSVSINGVSPAIDIHSLLDTICPGASTTMNVVPGSLACGRTTTYCNGTPATYTIGVGNSNFTTFPTCFAGGSPDAKMQMIFTAPELQMAGMLPGQIKGLTLYVTSKTSTIPYRDLTIRLGCTTQNSFATGGNYLTTSGIVTSLLTYSTTPGANYIPFQTAFNWDGVSNLVVEICYDNVATSGNDELAQTVTTLNTAKYATSWGSGVSGCTLTFGTVSSARPNITFTTCNTNLAIATYSWTPIAEITGSATVINPIAHPSTTTTYTCLIDDGQGCKATATKTIVVDHTTNIYIGSDTTLCNGQIYVPNPTVSGVAPYSYTWTSNPSGTNTNLATPSFSPTVTTTYYVDFHGYHNCLKKDTVKVTVNPIPTSTFTVNPNPVCSADSAVITYTGNAPASATFTWNFGIGAGPSVVVGKGPHKINWSTPGTKTVTLSVSNNGCVSNVTTNQVVVNLSPTALFNVTNSSVCTGSANLVTIAYSGNAPISSIYNWNFSGATVTSGSGKGPYTVFWNNSGVQNVSLTVNESGCMAQKTVPITVSLTPTSTFTASDVTPCSGQNVVMTYTGNMPSGVGVFSWIFPNGAPNIASGVGPHNVSFGSGGTYNASLSISNNGCVSPITILPIVVTQTPSSAFVVNPSNVCSDQITTISLPTGGAGPSAGYNWTVSGVTNPVQINGPGPFNISWTENGNSTINEIVTLTVSENGCTSVPQTVAVPVTPNPTADFTVSSPVCVGANATVTYIGVNNTANALYNWNFGSGTANSGSGKGPYQVAWPAPGIATPSLTVTQSGCSSAPFFVPVNVVDNPNVQAYAVHDHICPNDIASLWAEGANSYIWAFDGSNLPAVNVTPTTSPTVYTVTGTDNLGCKGTGLITIYWRPLPYVNAGNDTIINRGTSAHIGSYSNVSSYKYNWVSIPSFTVDVDSSSITSGNSYPYYALTSPTATSMYILLVEDNFQCKNSDTVNIVVKGCTQLEAPNAFNPTSANEANRYFRAANYRAMVSLTRFEIYNRWGVKLFSTNDRTSLGWDGKYQGVDQEMGSYTYYIEGKCEDGLIVHKEGNVTLIR